MPWLTEDQAERDRRRNGCRPEWPPHEWCVPPADPNPDPKLAAMMQDVYPGLFVRQERRKSA